MVKIGFLFIGYDQYEELKWTLHHFRHHSDYFKGSPVSVVLSGDPDKHFMNAGETMVRHVPNIVSTSIDDMREHFIPETFNIRPGIGKMHYREPVRSTCFNGSTHSMLRNYSVGIEALYESIQDQIDILVVSESNILILNDEAVHSIAARMMNENKLFATQTVSGYDDPVVKWTGQDILPQIFLVNWKFCKETRFLFEYEDTRPDAAELAIKDNLDMCLQKVGKNFTDDALDFGARSQWGVHPNPGFIPIAHLDRKPGADNNDGLIGWRSREEQLIFERSLLHDLGFCTGLWCKHT